MSLFKLWQKLKKKSSHTAFGTITFNSIANFLAGSKTNEFLSRFWKEKEDTRTRMLILASTIDRLKRSVVFQQYKVA
jgi:hypothetical protein